MSQEEPQLSSPKTGAIAATVGVLTLAAALVSNFEGDKHTAYRDVNGVPTICYGEAEGVHMGEVRTQAQCLTMLQSSLKEHAGQIEPCIHVAVPAQSMAAFISFSYNVGAGAFCRGSVARDLNAGNLAQACHDMLAYDRAGGRVVLGLENRRRAEFTYCLKGA